MAAGIVDRVHITDMHPVRNVVVQLAPLTVVVGQNDTGKSTLLDAVGQTLQVNAPGDGRPGRWQLTPPAERTIRAMLETDLPEGRLWVTSPQGGAFHTVTVDGVDMTPNELPFDVTKGLVRKIPTVVQIQLDRGRHNAEADLLSFLETIVDESRAAESSSIVGTLNDPHPSPFASVPGHLHEWVNEALKLVAIDAFTLMPSFVSATYERIQITAVDDPTLGLEFAITMFDDHGECPHHELSSGLRSWLNLAIGEATRRLGECEMHLDGHQVVRGERDTSPVLYVVDEPARHLHPLAAMEAAEWLYALTSSDAGEQTSCLVATHSPAFLQLVGRPGVEVIHCKRLDLPDDDVDHSVTVCEQWNVADLSTVHDYATAAGLTVADVFLTGTTPVILEGAHDVAYFRRVWLLHMGVEPEAMGIRFFSAQGVSQISTFIDDVVCRLYSTHATVHVITDNPAYDWPESAMERRNRSAHGQPIHVWNHAGFDIMALVPISRYMQAGVGTKAGTTWESIHEQRGKKVARGIANRSRPQLPGKAAMFSNTPNATRFATVVQHLEFDDIPDDVRDIVVGISRSDTSSM